MFGRETGGLPPEIMAEFSPHRRLRCPCAPANTAPKYTSTPPPSLSLKPGGNKDLSMAAKLPPTLSDFFARCARHQLLNRLRAAVEHHPAPLQRQH